MICSLSECQDEIKGSGVLFISDNGGDEPIIDWTGVTIPDTDRVMLLLHPGCFVALFKEICKQDRMIAGQLGYAPIEIIESELTPG